MARRPRRNPSYKQAAWSNELTAEDFFEPDQHQDQQLCLCCEKLSIDIFELKSRVESLEKLLRSAIYHDDVVDAVTPQLTPPEPPIRDLLKEEMKEEPTEKKPIKKKVAFNKQTSKKTGSFFSWSKKK